MIRPVRPTPIAIMTAPAPMTHLRLKRSTSRPTKGNDSADTNMKAAIARDTVDRVHPRSSVIGFSMRPMANLEPPLKNRTVNPVPRITRL